MTYPGVIIAGTDNYIMGLDGTTGELLWSKKIEDVKITKEHVWSVDGTDLILISDQTKKLGGIISNATLYALEVMTGDVIWYASDVKGRTLDVVPLLDKNLVLYITDRINLNAETLKEEPIIPYVYAIDIHTGRVKWEREYDREVKGVMLEDTWLGYKKFDLSGYYPPLNLGDELYFFYSGITRWNLETGETVWENTYPTGDQKLLKTDADPIFTEKVIYSAGRGQVKAIDRERGNIIWDSGTLGIVPQLLIEEDIIWAQKGGFFYNTMSNDWIPQGPFGVTALNATTGEVLWNYTEAKDSITNILLMEDKIVMGDGKHIITLDKYTGNQIFINDLRTGYPMFAFVNSEKNIIFKYAHGVEALNPYTGASEWEAGVEVPQGTLWAHPFMFTAGLFLTIMTAGAVPITLFSLLIVIDYAIPPGGATEARLKTQVQSEQAYWNSVKEYRTTPGLLKAEEARNRRLSLLEAKKQRDPHVYMEGQLPDRKDFIGLVGINTRDGNVDQGVYLGEMGEIYLMDYVEETLIHFDDDEITGYTLIAE